MPWRGILAGLVAWLAVLGGGPAAEKAYAENGPRSVAPVAEKLIDAVVNISTSQTAKGPQGLPLPEIPKGSPFDDLFQDFFDRRGGPRVPRKVSSLGSGFVVDGKEGLIVTNNHVIADADEIFINFHDGSKLKVDKVLGRDVKSDLALLKVTPKAPLVDVKFGSSEKLAVGDWVMAIGNPFGLGGTVTAGIVSARGRDIGAGPYDDFLQIDASINRGNSGGPTFNLDGKVVGVNSMIFSPSGGSVGIGFAISANLAKEVIADLMDDGRIERGWLGVSIQPLDEDLAQAFGRDTTDGVVVANVLPDSPAEAAGLEAGDVILAIDGHTMGKVRDVTRQVAMLEPGHEAEVKVLRDGSETVLTVKIGDMPGDEQQVASADQDADTPRLGISLAALDAAQREQRGLDHGVVVAGVEPGSPAAEKGLEPGDVLLEVNGETVSAPEQVVAAVEKSHEEGRKSVVLLVQHDDARRFVAVPTATS
ncbi:MAG: Do family serine endopeptidase [Geminicoccaceae bacterium]|nr:Do family serine endopeptidase [Geminicoccaceae bacterium]